MSRSFLGSLFPLKVCAAALALSSDAMLLAHEGSL
jgi:hypothetical protein